MTTTITNSGALHRNVPYFTRSSLVRFNCFGRNRSPRKCRLFFSPLSAARRPTPSLTYPHELLATTWRIYSSVGNLFDTAQRLRDSAAQSWLPFHRNSIESTVPICGANRSKPRGMDTPATHAQPYSQDVLKIRAACEGSWRSVAVSGQRSLNAKNSGHSAERLVSCPQKGGWVEKDGGDQLCVGQTNAKTVQSTSLDHKPYLTQLCHAHAG